jgi:hypothetical protein
MQARRVLLQQVAPAYHQASGSQKQRILEEFVAATGYARKYALWLLNHVEEVFAPPTVLRRRYGPEVEEALVLAWKTLNRICAKRFIPFLPDILETLEEKGHVQLSEEHRSRLLSMSASTADRLLQAHRYTHPHGLSITKAGPLLKQQIPIRTFAQWNEAKPGFLEVDLVAHCGGRLQGGCLYTVTLTAVATGWTECLPLLNRERETVLTALQRARTLFPFPILGLETDNGGEFINEEVAAYCVREQITFTRGRPYEKRDQCNALAEKWGRGATGDGPWPPGRRALLPAAGPIISRVTLVCELFSTEGVAGVYTSRGEKDPADLRRGQNAAATRATLRGAVLFAATGAACHRQSARPASALPASGTVAASDLALCSRSLLSQPSDSDAVTGAL